MESKFRTVYPACDFTKMDLIIKQHDGLLMSFVLQYFKKQSMLPKI